MFVIDVFTWRDYILKFIDWNISYAGDTERKIKYLQNHIADDTCVILQEVKPHAFEYIKTTLSDRFNLFYSLNYRKPSKFDSDARRLGVLVLISKDLEVIDSGAIERSPFPDRTVYVTLNRNGSTIKVLALHSLTGCGYYRSKSVQYDSFAEFIDEYRPDIIGIDANEPQVDHYDMQQMKFFDNGPGAKHFFDEMVGIGLTDAYVRANNIDDYEEGKPLIKSHNIRRKGAVRYDFLFAKDTYIVNTLTYNYDDAVAAGSDHAIIIGDIKID